ncbi:MAG: Apolipoprotein N-acyltransferase, partial [Spartobacteria bacterium]|nr:Apolipoprotein N-acyltransferase [Spartobacteria bacterium]
MRARGGLTTLARFWPWVAAIATGFLYAACFPPFNQQWLCWVCLTPLTAAVWFSGRNARRPWLRHLLLGYVSGIVFITTTFSWLGSLGILFESVWLRGLSLLLSLYMGLYMGFWSWFVGGIAPKNFVSSGRNLLCAFLAAAAWVPTEWIRGWLLGGFGWNGLGVALHAQWPLIQIAEFTGVAGLSFVIAFANVIAVTTPIRLYLEARTHRMRPHWDLNITMLGVMALLVWGWHVAHIPHPSKPFPVAAVQPGVPQKEKFKGQSPAEILDRCRRLSAMALQMNPPPGLLIWPESATPGPLFGDEQTHRFIMDFAASANTDLLLGTDEITEDRAYNTAVLLSDRGQNAQVYRKVHLVSFGEYVPLRHSFPLFAAVARRWVPGDFDAGNEYTVFQITNSDVRVAPLICFEDTVGELARRFVLPADDKPGANLLVNITNDGWFLHSVGAQQHLANAVFRCVELRRPMVRAANTGVTCFVNEFGRVTQILQDDVGSTFNEGVLAG